jgi:hypothetical protein
LTISGGGQLNVTGGSVNAGPLVNNGNLTVSGGSTVTNTVATIAPNLTSSAGATIGGTGSTWSSSSLYVGGNNTTAGGAGIVNINANATVNVAGPLVVWGNSGTALHVNSGTFNVTGATTIAAGGALTTSGATVLAAVTNDGAIVQSGGTTSVADLNHTAPNLGNITVSGGTLSADRVRQNNVTIASGSVVIRHGPIADVASRLRTLSITAGGKLDLNNNALILTQAMVGTWDGSAYDGITGYIASGRNNGAWNGSGIVTSESTATTSEFTTLVVASAAEAKGISGAETMLWAGQTISSTDVLVMYTYGGDCNLDGKLNILDYVKIDQGINAGLSGYINGDFNYDGVINILDYAPIIDQNINNQGPAFPSGSGMSVVLSGANMNGSLGGVSAVPEPALLVVPLAGALLMRRRKEHS